VYSTIRDNGGWDNWSMVEIEKYPCKDANEASAKEREWFERLNSSLNTYTPNKSHSECNRSYRSENRDKIKLIKKQYCETHKEQLILYRKQRYENNRDTIYVKKMCECGILYSYQNKYSHTKTKYHLQYMKS
jgi:hypothetical protein